MDHTQALSQIKEYLLQLIPNLPEEVWLRFVEKCVVRSYAKNTTICKPGMVYNTVSFVCSGLLRSYYLIDGKEIITAFAYENCYYSEYESFLTQTASKMYTTAMEDTTVVDINYKELQDLYSNSPECEKIGRLIAEDLFIFLSNRNSSFQFDTPETRYIKFLDDCEPIIQRIPQYMIASYLGLTPEALSRTRARMSKKSNSFIDSDQ